MYHLILNSWVITYEWTLELWWGLLLLLHWFFNSIHLFPCFLLSQLWFVWNGLSGVKLIWFDLICKKFRILTRNCNFFYIRNLVSGNFLQFATCLSCIYFNKWDCKTLSYIDLTLKFIADLVVFFRYSIGNLCFFVYDHMVFADRTLLSWPPACYIQSTGGTNTIITTILSSKWTSGLAFIYNYLHWPIFICFFLIYYILQNCSMGSRRILVNGKWYTTNL